MWDERQDGAHCIADKQSPQAVNGDPRAQKHWGASFGQLGIGLVL